MHVFKYSRRAGTRAADMPGQLTENQKGQRSDVLLKLDQEMSLEYRKSFLGEEKEVLMEEKIVIDGTEYLVGHTRRVCEGCNPVGRGQKRRHDHWNNGFYAE